MARIIRIKRCPLADQEHTASLRQYAHALHYPGVICVAQEFWELPESYLMGILAHELGHILSNGHKGERGANEEIWDRYGVHIQYRNSEYGKDLEYINEKDIQKLLNQVRIIF